MSTIDIEPIFLGMSLIISVILYILNARSARIRQREEFAERAAIKSLSPFLTEIHALEKACELLGRYPENFNSLRHFFDPEALFERISNAYMFLSNPAFEQNSLNLLMLLYHANTVFDRFEENSDIETTPLRDLALALVEVIIPLRQAALHAISIYRGQIGMQREIDYPIPFEEVLSQIEAALVYIQEITPPKKQEVLKAKDRKVLETIQTIWVKESCIIKARRR